MRQGIGLWGQVSVWQVGEAIGLRVGRARQIGLICLLIENTAFIL